MVKKHRARWAALQRLAQMKADSSAAEFAQRSKQSQEIEAKLGTLAASNRDEVGTTTDFARARLKYNSWAHRRRVELLSELSRERARLQPYKEAAQRDIARLNVLKKL